MSTVGLNIKNERTVALVRELAQRTGASQTAAIEDAVARRLAELGKDLSAHTDAKRRSAEQVLIEMRRHLTDADREAIRRADVDLYDEYGLPT
ncbi:type II toxin-antitoxin system VapB family antitoxin [soil metagenome]